MKVIKVYKNNKGQLIGKLWEDGVFRKEAKSSKHVMWMFKPDGAWGVDNEVHNDVFNDKIKELRILDHDTNQVYSVDAQTFVLNAESYQASEKDGLQWFLPMKYWTIKELESKN